jgi:hypothetical protein
LVMVDGSTQTFVVGEPMLGVAIEAETRER